MRGSRPARCSRRRRSPRRRRYGDASSRLRTAWAGGTRWCSAEARGCWSDSGAVSPDGGPEVIEFADYPSEGLVTLQAAQALARFLDRTCVCVRLHSTQQICVILNAHYSCDRASRARFEMERHALPPTPTDWCGRAVMRRHLPAVLWRLAAGPGDPHRMPARRLPGRRHYRAELTAADPVRRAARATQGVQNLIRAHGAVLRDSRLTVLGGTLRVPSGCGCASCCSWSPTTAGSSSASRLIAARCPAVIREHDVVVIPSLWECWPMRRWTRFI